MKAKDVKYVFEQNPELAKTGNKVQYYKYLKTIFPDSQVKDIVYHRGPEKIEVFNKSKIKDSSAKRFCFSPINTGIYGQQVTNALLDIKNLAKPGNKDFIEELNKNHPEYTQGKSKWFHLPAQIYRNADKYGYDGVFDFEGTNDDEYSVYEPEQIHSLGSQKDLQGFKKFIENSQKDSLEKRITAGFFIITFVIGILTSTVSLTGNVIGNSSNNFNFSGIALILLGIAGFLFNKKIKR